MAEKLTKEQVERLRVIKYKAEHSFMFFCMYMFKENNGVLFEPYQHLIQIADKLEEIASGKIKRLVINIFPRSGKAIDENTEILTDSGFKRAFEVRIGDKFIGSDGKFTNVNGVYPQGKTDLYRVKFSDNSYVDVSSDHIWTVKNLRDKKNYDLKTKELIDNLTHEKDNRSKWELPMIDCVIEQNTFEGSELTIDPYLLGVWIGDGSSSGAEITTMDDEIKDAFLKVYDKGIRTHQNSGKAETIGLINGFHNQLKDLNLIRNKHIPIEYLYASREDRISLLQGLMDSDGYCDKRGQPSFCQKNKQTLKDFKYLVSSLGGVYGVQEKNGSENIRVRFPSDIIPFSLKRKYKRLTKPSTQNKPRRILKSITKLENANTICFSVDAKDKLFTVTRDLILTHNTEMAVKLFIAWGLALNQRSKFIHLSYSGDLALDNSANAKEYINSEAFQSIWKMDLRIDSKAKQKWFNKRGGGCYATSVNGQITGFGAGDSKKRETVKDENPFKGFSGAIIIDDPNKPSDTFSDIERAKVNQRYNNTIRSRVNNPRETPIIVIQQRLHEEDMSGFLLDGGSGEEWVHLNLPALDENNVALCPEKFTFEELMNLKETDPYTFNGQYMQSPTAGDGGMWLTHWFNIKDLSEIPSIDSWQLYIDGAYTKNTANDPTGLMICSKNGNDLIVLSAVSKYMEMPELLKYIPQYINSLGVYVDSVLIEPKASGLSMAQLLRNQTNYNIIELRGNILRESKIERASKSSPYIESGRVTLVNGSWNNLFLDQVSKFPLGKHDEYVDLLSYAIDRSLFKRNRAKIIW